MAWSARYGALGDWAMHDRDLYLLADALEAPGDFDVFQWANAPKS